jgi:haloalkane dehalogenase
MQTLRTPDERFADLPGFPYGPHYADVADGEGGSLRVHYLREGDPAAPVVLLMHGEPSWSYLYRKMIPVLVSAGLQIVAPDLVGFGRSDKPTERADSSGPTTRSPATWSGRASCSSTGSICATSPWSARTGAG